MYDKEIKKIFSLRHINGVNKVLTGNKKFNGFTYIETLFALLALLLLFSAAAMSLNKIVSNLTLLQKELYTYIEVALFYNQIRNVVTKNLNGYNSFFYDAASNTLYTYSIVISFKKNTVEITAKKDNKTAVTETTLYRFLDFSNLTVVLNPVKKNIELTYLLSLNKTITSTLMLQWIYTHD